jgi:hypothetical protein
VSLPEFDEEDDFIYAPNQGRGQRIDPAIMRMALGAGGVSLVVILIALFYSGFRTGGFGPPPEIAPPDVPLRVVPTSPGGMVVPGANVPIMSGNLAQFSATPQLAPQTAAPDISQLDQAAGLTPAAVPPAAAPPAGDAVSPPAPPPPGLADVPAMVLLAQTPDLAGAMTAWNGLQKQFPDQLKGRSPLILPSGSQWLVRLGGFPSGAAASSFCAGLVAKGARCSVVSK